MRRLVLSLVMLCGLVTPISAASPPAGAVTLEVEAHLRDLLVVDVFDAEPLGGTRVTAADLRLATAGVLPPEIPDLERGDVRAGYVMRYDLAGRDVELVLLAIEFDAKITRPDLDAVRYALPPGLDLRPVPELRDAVRSRQIVTIPGVGDVPAELVTFVTKQRMFQAVAVGRAAIPEHALGAAQAVVDNLVAAGEYQRAPRRTTSLRWELAAGVVVVAGLVVGGIILRRRRHDEPSVSNWSDPPPPPTPA